MSKLLIFFLTASYYAFLAVQGIAFFLHILWGWVGSGNGKRSEGIITKQ